MSKILKFILSAFLICLLFVAKFQSSYLLEIVMTYVVILGILIVCFIHPDRRENNQKNKLSLKIITIFFLFGFLTYQTIITSNVIIDYLLDDKQTKIIQLDNDIRTVSGGKGSTKYYINIEGVNYQIVRPYIPEEFNVKGKIYEVTILNGSKKIIEFNKKS